jgi:hypothetical protein
MPKYVIERDMPAVGTLTSDQLRAASRKSAAAMEEIGKIHWVQSYMTDDKIYCVYVAPNEDTIRRHAEQAGLPANRISRVRTLIDAACAE